MSDYDATAPLTTTIKLPGANAPWIVIRSENSVQLDQQLNELMANGVGATIGRAQDMIEAQFNTGKGLGARPVDAPVDTGAYAPPQQQAQPVQQYQQPQQQAPQQYQAPAPQQQYQQPAAPAAQATPGAPMIAGMPAKLVSGNKNGRQWQAWADPRPKDVTEGMQRTDDPFHPGLNQGTHSFWKFIR